MRTVTTRKIPYILSRHDDAKNQESNWRIFLSNPFVPYLICFLFRIFIWSAGGHGCQRQRRVGRGAQTRAWGHSSSAFPKVQGYCGTFAGLLCIVTYLTKIARTWISLWTICCIIWFFTVASTTWGWIHLFRKRWIRNHSQEDWRWWLVGPCCLWIDWYVYILCFFVLATYDNLMLFAYICFVVDP